MTTTYPARLEGILDPQLSRWLWLVKWILVFPHVVVLVVLWIAAAFVGIIALFAILFTGKYPRPLFDFVVGVLRWSWRVAFYSLGVLATDKYPPFTLKPVPEYPASFDVDYPAELSRWKVLLKSWLLAFPHLLIIGAATGGTSGGGTGDEGMTDNRMNGDWTMLGAEGMDGSQPLSLLGVLAIITGVILLVRNSYPRALFDLLMGAHRWGYRVATYVTLLRDEYPPFRLDQGGAEPTVVGSVQFEPVEPQPDGAPNGN